MIRSTGRVGKQVIVPAQHVTRTRKKIAQQEAKPIANARNSDPLPMNYAAVLAEKRRGIAPEKRRAAMQKWLSKPGNKEQAQRRHGDYIKRRTADDPGFAEHRKQLNRNWRKKPENRERVRLQRAEQYAEKPQYRCAHNLRVRLRIALRRFRAGKRASAIVALGCSIAEACAHIESTWQSGMTWGNYGNDAKSWSIDHVKPLSAFDLTDPEQQAAACHYTNLQALWHIDNLRKHAKFLSR